MTNFKQIILDNRTNMKALSKAQFETKEDYISWRQDVEYLRLRVSNYAVYNRMDAKKEDIAEEEDFIWDRYKEVLSYFTDKSVNEKVKPQASDFNSLLTIIGCQRKVENTGKQFMPVSSIAFRKAIEDFISDRITAASYRTAEDIEAEKQERRVKRAEEQRIKRAAEKAQKEAQQKTEKSTKKTTAKKAA